MTAARNVRPFALAIQDTLRMLHTIREGGQLPMFTVTDHPRDWPDFYVARLSVTGGKDPHVTSFAIMDPSLERIQTTMQALGLVKLHRSPEDDPVILETWV